MRIDVANGNAGAGHLQTIDASHQAAENRTEGAKR
jgi:hypothetical protein